MPWWNGVDVEDYMGTGKKFHIDYLLNVLNDMVDKPDRNT
jgi:elongation factor 1-alpha